MYMSVYTFATNFFINVLFILLLIYISNISFH